MKCPTRRSGIVVTPTSTSYKDGPGPQGDYAVLFHSTNPTILPGKTTSADPGAPGGLGHFWWYYWGRSYWSSTMNDTTQARFTGPFIIANLTNTADLNTWQPASDFSRWRDGTTNQFIIGEKHIPRGSLGKCQTGTGAIEKVYNGDCTYMMTGKPSMHGAMGRNSRTFNDHEGMIAKSPYFRNEGSVSGPDCRPNDGYGFGSYHPGTCMFLMGDGSIQSISVTISDDIVLMLSDVADGGVVSIP
jgi:hypothetical protein